MVKLVCFACSYSKVDAIGNSEERQSRTPLLEDISDKLSKVYFIEITLSENIKTNKKGM